LHHDGIERDYASDEFISVARDLVRRDKDEKMNRIVVSCACHARCCSYGSIGAA
jgi:hypothetical protein